MGGKVVDLTDQRFGKLVVVSRSTNKIGRVSWDCLCDCGSRIIVLSLNLRAGNTKSCGCYRRERLSTHNLTNHPLYRRWGDIKQRCFNPDSPAYLRYGGRGISMHQPWVDSFEVFLSDVGEPSDPALTLDRIDNNLGYEPGNLRWATAKQQSNNKRNNIVLNGNTLKAWSEELGISYSLLYKRIKRGWAFEDAITKPSRNKVTDS